MEEIRKLTFESACKEIKLDGKKILSAFKSLPVKERKWMIAHTMCVYMAMAANKIANGGKVWKPKYGPDTPWKYEARWIHKGGASGFRYDVYDFWLSYSYVGSRLCFINHETMTDLTVHNKAYIKAWNDYAVIK